MEKKVATKLAYTYNQIHPSSLCAECSDQIVTASWAHGVFIKALSFNSNLQYKLTWSSSTAERLVPLRSLEYNGQLTFRASILLCLTSFLGNNIIPLFFFYCLTYYTYSNFSLPFGHRPNHKHNIHNFHQFHTVTYLCRNNHRYTIVD